MTITKKLLSVQIETQSGGSFTVADTADNMAGTAVWGMITAGRDILYKDGEDFQFIAADCVCSAKATPSEATVEVEDANCNFKPCGE